MVIKIMRGENIRAEKLEKTVQELEELQKEVVEYVKVALSQLITIDHLYDVKNHIDQLLIDWEEPEIDFEDEDDDYE